MKRIDFSQLMPQLNNIHTDYNCKNCKDVGILESNALCNCKAGYKIFNEAMRESGIKLKYINARISHLDGQIKSFFNKVYKSDSFYLFGTVGVGKTYAASAFIKRLIWLRYRKQIGEVEGVGLYNRYKYLLLDFRDLYDETFNLSIAKTVDYLIIDDVFAQFKKDNFSFDHVLPNFEILLERRINQKLETSFISNLKLDNFKKIAGARIADRVNELIKHSGEIVDKSKRGIEA